MNRDSCESVRTENKMPERSLTAIENGKHVRADLGGLSDQDDILEIETYIGTALNQLGSRELVPEEAVVRLCKP